MGRKHSFMVGSLFIVQVPVLNECLQTFLRSFGVRVTEFVMRTRDAGLCRGPATPGSLDVPAGSSETELPPLAGGPAGRLGGARLKVLVGRVLVPAKGKVQLYGTQVHYCILKRELRVSSSSGRTTLNLPFILQYNLYF